MTSEELLRELRDKFGAIPVDEPVVGVKIIKKMELPPDTYDYSVKEVILPQVEQLNLL
jgi:hypothetical protein|tara:strand:- start:2454 stop:2627 length:174 start_codon:yes stop_codon:yes gene_type:complete